MSCSTLSCSLQVCSGYSGSVIQAWQQNDCLTAYYTFVNTGTTAGTGGTGTVPAPFAYNPGSMTVAQGYVSNLFSSYLSTYSLTDNTSSPAYNSFQETLVDLCAEPSLPGICANFLETYCSQFTRAEAVASGVLTDLCGCYVPPDPSYLKYTLGSSGCAFGTGCTAGCTAGEPGCTGQPACDPLCHRAATSQRAYVPSGALITCPQNICAISDVTINSVASRVPGGINFNSVCSGCGGGGGCLCVVTGVDISSTLSQIGLGANYTDFCSGNSLAITTDAAGNVVSEEPLSQVNVTPEKVGHSYSLNINIGLISLAVLILVILIVLLIFQRRSRKQVSDALEVTT